jgi:hypothetical protein
MPLIYHVKYVNLNRLSIAALLAVWDDVETFYILDNLNNIVYFIFRHI